MTKVRKPFAFLMKANPSENSFLNEGGSVLSFSFFLTEGSVIIKSGTTAMMNVAASIQRI